MHYNAAMAAEAESDEEADEFLGAIANLAGQVLPGLVGGLFRIVSIFLESSLWGWKLVGGVLGILAGIVVMQHPLWSSVLVPAIYVIILGIQALISGGVSLVLAFSGGGWGAAILGALSIVFGLVLLFNVWIGVALLPFILGAVGIVGGGAAIVLAFAMRSMERGGESVRDPEKTEEEGEARPV